MEEEPAGHDELRRRLIEAAADVFSERGYDRAGVQEIARRADLTTGAIYGRFTGKDELLVEAIRARTLAELDSLFSGRPSSRADILSEVGAHLATRDRRQGDALLLEAFALARRDPGFAELLQSLLAERTQLIEALIEGGKEEGTIDPDLDTEAIVRFAYTVGLGWALVDSIGMPRPEPRHWEQVIRRAVASLAPADPIPDKGART